MAGLVGHLPGNRVGTVRLGMQVAAVEAKEIRPPVLWDMAVMAIMIEYGQMLAMV